MLFLLVFVDWAANYSAALWHTNTRCSWCSCKKCLEPLLNTKSNYRLVDTAWDFFIITSCPRNKWLVAIRLGACCMLSSSNPFRILYFTLRHSHWNMTFLLVNCWLDCRRLPAYHFWVPNDTQLIVPPTATEKLHLSSKSICPPRNR